MKTIGSGFLSAQGPHRNIKEIDVSVQGAALDYAAAHAIADVLAKKVARATMLVAWFDASRRTFFSTVRPHTGSVAISALLIFQPCREDENKLAAVDLNPQHQHGFPHRDGVPRSPISTAWRCCSFPRCCR
jgi:hypothetical protein